MTKKTAVRLILSITEGCAHSAFGGICQLWSQTIEFTTPVRALLVPSLSPVVSVPPGFFQVFDNWETTSNLLWFLLGLFSGGAFVLALFFAAVLCTVHQYRVAEAQLPAEELEAKLRALRHYALMFHCHVRKVLFMVPLASIPYPTYIRTFYRRFPQLTLSYRLITAQLSLSLHLVYLSPCLSLLSKEIFIATCSLPSFFPLLFPAILGLPDPNNPPVDLERQPSPPGCL